MTNESYDNTLLIVDNQHGLYIPQVFAILIENHLNKWNVDERNWKILRKGPNFIQDKPKAKQSTLDAWDCLYRDIWECVLNTAKITLGGHDYTLAYGECGDLFAFNETGYDEYFGNDVVVSV